MSRELDPKKRLTHARVNLMLKFPFFGELVMKMHFIESRTAGVGTTCVDYKGNMYYHPEWIMELGSLSEVMFELCHEVMHLVQRCTVRFPNGGNHRLWNIAADIKVDTILVDSNLTQSAISKKNITKALMNKHRHRTTEQIYYYLIAHPEEADAFGPCPYADGSGGDGPNAIPGSQVGERGCISGSLHGNPGSAEDINKMKQYIMAAALAAQSRGKSCGFANEFLVNITSPTVKWIAFLRRLATIAFNYRYTHNRPSRRSHTIGMKLPSRTPTPNGAIITIDTSGSIPDEFLCQAITECVGIMKETGCKWIKIYFHDTECYWFEDYSRETITKIKVTKAGTSHVDVFKKIDDNENNVALVIAFTDLATKFPIDKPKYPVIWAHPEGNGEERPITFGMKLPVRLAEQ